MSSDDSSWLARLKAGLAKTSSTLGEGIASVFTKRKLDAETLEQLEELLVQADMGAATSAKIVAAFGRQRLDKEIAADEIKETLAHEIAAILMPVAHPLHIDAGKRPHVILVVGVNGNGKTTTIGKLAHYLKGQGHTVMMAAVDTFRAAAVDQLKIWGGRTGCEVVSGEANADPASVAYKALEHARAKGAGVLLIDSAGRLHNKTNLMAELQKILKVIRKLDDSAPHSVVLVLDATTGQNAINQVEVFGSMVGVTGLVVTKLDGTARGGIVVALADRFRLPIHAIGVGEGTEDLRPFASADFARRLVGL